MASPLDGLQTLYNDPMQSEASGSDALKLQMLRKARLDEMQRNRELAAIGGPAPVSTRAAGFDVRDLQSDIAEEPSTGVGTQQRVSDIGTANLGANLSGYADPQEAAAAGRAAEGAKSEIPVRVMQAQQAGEAGRLGQTITGQQAIEKMKEDAAAKRAADFMSSLRNMPTDLTANTE